MEIKWLLLSFLTVSLSCTVHGATWRVSPRDTKVRLGHNATLYCEVDGLLGNMVIWQKNGFVLFVNTIMHKGTERSRIETGHGNGQFNLRIGNVVEEDDGVYTCSVSQSELSKSAHLQVIVAPKSARLTIDKTGDLWEGQKVKFNCSSRGGNPPPQVSWYRGDVPLSVGHTSHAPSEKFGTASDVTEWTLTKDDHNKTFSCAVENDANLGNPVGAFKTISVQYAPGVSILPEGTVQVLEDDSITLTCHVDANPAVVRVRWFRGGVQQLETGLTYHIPKAQKGSDDTVYECVAENSRGDCRQTATLQVIYSPKVNIPQASNGRVIVNESSTVNITCDVDAYPAPDSVYWRKVGSPGTIAGRSLILYNVHKDHSGTYQCEASNLLQPTGKNIYTGSSQATVELIVQHLPAMARLEQVPRGRIVKGQEVMLRCTSVTPGYPAATMHWTKESDPAFTFEGSELRLNQVQLQDNGIYACTPKNNLGAGPSAKTQLIINEEVTFLAPSLPQTKYLRLEDTDVIMTCQVRGKPAPQVTWYKDGRAIPRSSDFFTVTVMEQPVDIHSHVVSSQLQFKGRERQPNIGSVRMEDSGNYTCLASNNIGDDKSKKVQVLVQYVPVVTAVDPKLAVDINSTASISCRAAAFPAPRFEWYKGDDRVAADSRVRINAAMKLPGKVNMYVAKLSLSDVRSSDLGKYTCLARNSIGDGKAEIYMTVKTVPDAPNNLTVSSVTWESVMLSWQPAFDGGYRQTFTVVYTSEGKPTGRVEVQPFNINLFNVTGLSPGRRYTFMVYGKNQFGVGAYSATKSVTTQDLDFELPLPTEIRHDRSRKILTFTSPNENFCVRIGVMVKSGKWQVYEHCAPSSGGSVRLDWKENIVQVNLSYCLERRTDICSSPVVAETVNADDVIPLTTAIILGSVCGSTLVLTVLILAVVCIKKHRNKDTESNDPKKARSIVVTTVTANNGKGYNGGNMLDVEDPAANNAETSHMLSHDFRHVAFGPPHRKPDIGNSSYELKVPPREQVYNNFVHSSHYSNGNSTFRDISKPQSLDLNNSGESVESLPTSLDFPRSCYAKLDTHSNSSSVESGYSTPSKSKHKIIHEIIV